MTDEPRIPTLSWTRKMRPGAFNGPEPPVYRIGARCDNCNAVVVLRLSFGYEFPSLSDDPGPECPVCGCHSWCRIAGDLAVREPVEEKP